MNDQADTDRTAALLRAALHSAADVMTDHDASVPDALRPAEPATRGWGRLAPLAAAAGVAVIAGGAVIGAHLAGGHPGTGAPSATVGSAAQGAQTAKPEFYLTVTYPASGQNVLQFQVRRTDGGAVTGEKTIPAANVGWGGYLASGPGDRTFYFAHYECTAADAHPSTTFDRISVTSSGRISAMTADGRSVPGMVTSFAVSPQGTQVAYNALPGACVTGRGFLSSAAASVSVADLATGAVRTWQDTGAKSTDVSQLSWTPNGRTVIVDERPRGLNHVNLTVFGLDASSPGGSLQAHSTTLLRQTRATCSTCVTMAIAGPDGSLTELASQPAGQGSKVLVLSVPTAAGSHRTVLFSAPSAAPVIVSAGNTNLFADPSGEWLLLWPGGSFSQKQPIFHGAGYIAGGRLHPLTGLGQIFPQGIAW